MPDQTELDTRIRALVARAVADAPAPPELDPADVPVADDRPDRRGWWFGGGATALAAAALVTAFVLVGDADESVTTPDDRTGDVDDAGAGADDVRGSAARDVGHRCHRRRHRCRLASCSRPGPDGVVEHRGGDARTLTTEPMAIALDAGDGRRHRPAPQRCGAGSRAGTTPTPCRSSSPPTASLTDLFDTADWDGAVVLHDVEVVERPPAAAVQRRRDRPCHRNPTRCSTSSTSTRWSAPRSRRTSAAGSSARTACTSRRPG